MQPFSRTLIRVGCYLLAGAGVSFLVAAVAPLIGKVDPQVDRIVATRLDLAADGWVARSKQRATRFEGDETRANNLWRFVAEDWLAGVDQSKVIRVDGYVGRFSGTTFDHFVFTYLTVGEPTNTGYVVQEVTSGFPFRSATGMRRGPSHRATETLGAIEVPDIANPNAKEKNILFGAVPLRPILPGLLANTTIYALVLWLTVAAAQTLRRHFRRRRNRCPACNYDRSGLAVETPCPECGRPLAS